MQFASIGSSRLGFVTLLMQAATKIVVKAMSLFTSVGVKIHMTICFLIRVVKTTTNFRQESYNLRRSKLA